MRHQAHQIQAIVDTLLQELPAEPYPEDMQEGVRTRSCYMDLLRDRIFGSSL